MTLVQAPSGALVITGSEPPDSSEATVRSAAAGLDGPEAVEALIARVASPGGTTEAGLNALCPGLDAAVSAAVDAARARAEALSRS